MRCALNALKWFIISALIILVLQLNPNWRLVHTVATYQGWRTQLLGERQPGLVVGFDHRAIRKDFVHQFNEAFIVSTPFYKYNGVKRNDEVIRELERRKLLGAWVDGNTLYVSDTTMIVAKELGVDQFGDMLELFRRNLNSRKLTDKEYSKWRQGITDDEYCCWTTISDHFAKCVLKGPDGLSATISLPFRWKKELSGGR